MEPIGELGLTNTLWLAVALAILESGVATVAWEWRDAHTAALKHGSSPP